MNHSTIATPSIPHYVNVFNKTQKTLTRLTPQVHPLIAGIQQEYDLALALRQARLAKVSIRESFVRLNALFH